ncbi:hypothetical protein EVJ58_g7469 [Rhodofomes roseus]|uniref:Uncharacterized protein n=1 Tax=Rhodofomes roseus TaxID=34475 RepID=A0A4Y9Y475_9APHY|nr:hypothetical protein EVJ58_g7469 [Rhodofomes roseus]
MTNKNDLQELAKQNSAHQTPFDGEELKESIPASAGQISPAPETQSYRQLLRPPFRSPLPPLSACEQATHADTIEPEDANRLSVDHTAPSIAFAAPNSYLEYSLDIATFPFPTVEHANGTPFNDTGNMAESDAMAHSYPHNTASATSTVRPLPIALRVSPASVNNFGAVTASETNTSATAHDLSYQGLPSPQACLNNVAFELGWSQWGAADVASNDDPGVLPEGQGLTADTTEEGHQGGSNATTEWQDDGVGNSDENDAALLQEIEYAPTTARPAEPPAGLLWTDAPSVELVGWFNLPDDFSSGTDASPEQVIVNDGFHIPGLSGSDQFDPWSGSGGPACSSQGTFSHDCAMLQKDW